MNVVYGKGTFGHSECAVSDGQVATFTDTKPTSEGGDPEPPVDAAAQTVERADEVDGKRRAVRLKLDAAKR